ncbi:hypothetical protein D3C81_1123540 [compost metagenome]
MPSGSSLRPWYQPLSITDSLRSPGRYCQISSAVNARIGAIQRTSASLMWYSAVWQERRATLLAPVVYWRSLMMSR